MSRFRHTADQNFSDFGFGAVGLAPKWALRNLERIGKEFYENYLVETACVSDINK
jgi:hypothetical protein